MEANWRGIRIAMLAVLAATGALVSIAVKPATADEPILGAADYPGMSTFSCRTEAITLVPGQNLNAFDLSRTCPNAQLVDGPGNPDIFLSDSLVEYGFITRFKPNMVEIKKTKVWVKGKNGKRRPVIKTTYPTPSVDDLHLHHVVWIRYNQPSERFASGEEKTYVKLPQGYGYRVGSRDVWMINHMLHNLTATPNRRVYLTWEIDWVPATPSRSDIEDVDGKWLDVAGDNTYPVFDAKKDYSNTQPNDLYTFPEDVPGYLKGAVANEQATSCAAATEPGSQECENIAITTNGWKVPQGGATLISGAGHLHPGGKYVDVEVDRDLPVNAGGDNNSVPGTTQAETKRIFRSDAKYYEPAGATSWDVSMEATEPNWRIKLKENDVVRVSTTYDVSKGDWIESMGIMPMAFVAGRNELNSFDPWDDASNPTLQDVTADDSGILTHGRLPENIDKRANTNLRLANPGGLPGGARVGGASKVNIESFLYSAGGYFAIRGYPRNLMRPAVVNTGQSITFVNRDALASMTQAEQAWHSITSCAPPCNRGPGIGYPLANGEVRSDSGQLGFGADEPLDFVKLYRGDGPIYKNRGVTTGSNSYTTPPFTEPGLYTYFCRLHPYMRASVRVKQPN